MVFTDVCENTFREILVKVHSLKEESFNPCDYIGFSTLMKTPLDELDSIANISSERTWASSNQRIFSAGVDRVTGEVFLPSHTKGEEETINCIRFNQGDILFHKIGARIGRIGLTDFSGYGESEFLTIKANTVNAYYLLLALRAFDVLTQLPFRETARPRIKRKDIEHLKIPRLGELEDAIGQFVSRVFSLRKRARIVLNDLLETFDNAISAKMPTDYSFLMPVQDMTEKTLDPGYYFIKVVEVMLPNYAKLLECVDIIHPPTLERGDKYHVVTAKSYRFEGLVPETPRGVSNIEKKNLVHETDILINRIISTEKIPWKATVVPAQFDYLKSFGLTVQHSEDGRLEIPVSEDLFILRKRLDAPASPYYVVLVLNSLLCRAFLNWTMGGSTGMQVIKKSRLGEIRLPLLETHVMKAFSVATEISLQVLSETLRTLVLLSDLYEKVIRGEASPEQINELIQKELTTIQELEGNALNHLAQALLETRKLKYEVNAVLLA